MQRPGHLAMTLITAAALAVAATGCGSGRLEESTAPAVTPIAEAPPTEEVSTSPAEVEPSEESTPEGEEFLGSGSWTDYDNYEYSLSYSVELGEARSDPADAKPGFTHLSVQRSWDMSLTNETGGGHAATVSGENLFHVIGLYPAGSPLCTEFRDDASKHCAIALAEATFEGERIAADITYSPFKLADGESVTADAAGFGPLKVLIPEGEIATAAKDLLSPDYLFVTAMRMNAKVECNLELHDYSSPEDRRIVVTDATEPGCEAYDTRAE